ncbi:unnamed protein product [Didymodactylos carnosus]|nr:unnamed protein product [Didymodactylos carnosus]CAF4414317.1 unnamed protein product [Didymodactylos carnosus]
MLAVNKRLRSLHLGVNSLGNLGVKYLFIEGSNIQLHYLNLCCNRIDHEGCQYLVKMLARNETLTYFDIGGNAIKDRGVQEICNSLLNNQTLTELHMWHCQITDSNAIGDLLKSNLTLVELDLEGNHITDNGGMIIADILLSTTIKSKTLKLLNLSHNKITDKCTKRLITITDLTVVV